MRARILPLEQGYTAEFDAVDRNEWQGIIDGFSDSSLFQTWPFDSVRSGEERVSHFVLRRDNAVLAGAQVRILPAPAFRLGAAYVRWGPLWQFRNGPEDPSVFRCALRALRNEYVCRRGFILRILPLLYRDPSSACHEILLQEDFKPVAEKEPSRTMVLDLTPSLETLRGDLSQRWRRCLTKAERNDLEIVEGTEDMMFEEFISIYRDLLQRKRFQKPNDIHEFRRIQRDLPDAHKMNIILCRANGRNTAGGIFSAIGDSGVYLFGATNDQGMHNNGSYLVHWTAVQWMKRRGCHYYNLYGVNASKNPGTFVFKEGLAGKKGKILDYLGRFDSYPNALASGTVRLADRVLPFMKKLRAHFGPKRGDP
jgi:hypothetical protein